MSKVVNVDAILPIVLVFNEAIRCNKMQPWVVFGVTADVTSSSSSSSPPLPFNKDKLAVAYPDFGVKGEEGGGGGGKHSRQC